MEASMEHALNQARPAPEIDIAPPEAGDRGRSPATGGIHPVPARQKDLHPLPL